ncbi:MAG: ABC transporter ATP-binding protein [Alphaproteobacteria bacterium]
MNELIQISNLKKIYYLSNKDELLLIDNLNLTISKNSITSITGPSGCGKSTLLNIIGLLDSNFHGNYFFESKSIKEINSKNLSNIRNEKIGFVHQFFHLIPELTVLENVILPALVQSNKISDINNEAYKLLETFEIIDKKNMKPNKLSGGEQQRVAIARSLINKPNLVLADEMTGNLDEKTSDEIINFFLKFVANHNLSLMYVTHNKKYAEMANIKYELRNKNLILND